MLSLGSLSKTFLHALAAMLLFATLASAQIAGLCNTGQTAMAIGTYSTKLCRLLLTRPVN